MKFFVVRQDEVFIQTSLIYIADYADTDMFLSEHLAHLRGDKPSNYHSILFCTFDEAY